MKLSGKTAVVTGAGRGIGRAIALLFAKEGACVVVNSARSETGSQVAKEIQDLNGKAIAFPGDVSNEEFVQSLVDTAISKFGSVDILINNAGIALVKPTEEVTGEEWSRVIDINLRSAFLCSRNVARHMIRARHGRIVNIASIGGIRGAPLRAAYCASKGGMIALTRALAVEWAKHGILVNAIAPGFVKTDIYLDRFKSGILKEEDVAAKIPVQRLATSEEIARAALFLSSDDSSYITGQVIVADGGLTAFGYS